MLLGALSLVVGPPLSLVLMCVCLRLLGVPREEVRKKALRFTDRWIDQHGKRGLSGVANALVRRRPKRRD
jgi:hypothetical protein